ncbi:MAG: MinD/ParA family protein [Planctomycetaceae bacterium]
MMIDDERFHRLRSAYHQDLSADPARDETAAESQELATLTSVEQKLASLISSLPSFELDSHAPDADEKAQSGSAPRISLKSHGVFSSSELKRSSRLQTPIDDRSQCDQAQMLRGMIEQNDHPQDSTDADHPRVDRAYTISVTSGKGGVGKSLISLNLAIAIARQGFRVCLMDANLGLGNIDLLCGMNGYWNLSHVVIGARELSDIILTGPAGIDLIPGASGLADLADCTPAAQKQLLRQMKKLEDDYDFLILDTGTGIHHVVRRFVTAADLVLVVTTPEPTAIADAYATIKALNADDVSRMEVLVNQCDADYGLRVIDRIQQTTKLFLHKTIGSAGTIPHDPQMIHTVLRRKPLLLEAPQSPAALALIQLSRRMLTLKQGQVPRPHFFERMWNRILNRST